MIVIFLYTTYFLESPEASDLLLVDENILNAEDADLAGKHLQHSTFTFTHYSTFNIKFRLKHHLPYFNSIY